MPRFDSYGPRDSQISSSGDTFFSGFNNRLRPDQLQAGELAYSQNGRMNVDGAWQPRKGIEYFGGTIPSPTYALTIPFYLYATKSISSASRSTTTVTVTTSSAHGFTTSTQVGIAGLTGSVNPNGNRIITVTDSTHFTFTIAGAAGSESYGGTGTAGAPFIQDQSIDAAWGSCRFSDPSNNSAEYIIIALNENAIAINLTTAASTTIAYPSGITISSAVKMVQAFNKVYIFRGGSTALSWNGTLTGSPAFAKVANGTYAATVYLDANNNTSTTDGITTVSETSHGLSVGDRVYVVDNGSTALTEDGEGYVVATVPNANSFTFYSQIPDHASDKVVYAKKQPSQLGFSHMPAPAWGVYHQRRMIVPYFYTTTGSSGSEVITSRNVRDEILISDVLDSDTYDTIQAQLKVTAGIADYLQYVHPFTEDNAIIFNRNSIHLMSGFSGSIADITINEITREAGLVAQKSVVTIGNKIFFLSDNGVYATEFGDLYNLRGAGLPLSDAIDPLIKRINSTYAANAVACYHDNRYYLAVPLDDSIVNDTILIYNLLNQKWESVDNVSPDNWDIANLVSSGAGGVNKLYAVNRTGGIHIIDYREDDVDRLAIGAGNPPFTFSPSYYATTRQYTGGTTDRKKFNTFELHLESSASNASNGTISVETENMDSTTELGTIANYLDQVLPTSEDAIVRGRIGNMRGYGIQMTLTPTQGRPKMRTVRINSITSGGSTLPSI